MLLAILKNVMMVMEGRAAKERRANERR